MRKVLTVLFLHVKEFFKSPGVLVLMFIMPAVFCFIFGGIAVNSEVKKPVVNVVSNKDKLSSEIVNLLKKNDQFQWKKASLKQAKENASSQKSVAAVVIPASVGQRIAKQKSIFEVIVERKSEDYLALSPYLEGTAKWLIQTNQTLSSQQLGPVSLSDYLKELRSSKGVQLEQTVVQKNKSDNQSAITLMFVGFAIMFMMFGLSGAVSAILDEREEGTWGRLLVSPISKLQLIFGYLLSYFLMGWIEFAMIMIAMNVLFHTAWGNLLYLVPFASLVILCVVGFSLMLAGLVKTKQQAAAIGAVLIVSTCMLGGVYWSIDLVPDYMQKISMGVPQSWAMSGFKEIISGSMNGKNLLNDIVALLAFTAVFFFVGLKRMKFE